MDEREVSERRTDGLYKKLQELFSNLSVTLGGDLGQPVMTSFDNLSTKVRHRRVLSHVCTPTVTRSQKSIATTSI